MVTLMVWAGPLSVHDDSPRGGAQADGAHGFHGITKLGSDQTIHCWDERPHKMLRVTKATLAASHLPPSMFMNRTFFSSAAEVLWRFLGMVGCFVLAWRMQGPRFIPSTKK